MRSNQLEKWTEPVPWQQMKTRLKAIAADARLELRTYQIALRDCRTPWLAKALFWLAIAYLLLPFDLLPDFIPVLGQLDDLFIVPLLLLLAIKLTPDDILREARAQASGRAHA